MKRNHTLKIEHSRVVEVLSCIRSKALESDHVEIKSSLDRICIPESSEHVVSTIRSIPEIGYGFHEFLLASDERDDVKAYFGDIRKMETGEKLLMFLGIYHVEDIDIFDKEGHVSKAFKTLLKKNTHADIDALCQILENFDEYLESYEVLCLEIAESDAFIEALSGNILDDVKADLNDMKDVMTRRHPTSYAQALMGKSFWNISDWDEHEFIPVYFNSPKTVRIFNADKNIMVKTLYKRSASGDELKAVLKDKLKLLSDPTRLSILRMTYMKPMYGKEIADELGLTTATVSHHLDLLRKAGLLNMEQDRHIKYFSTNTRGFNSLIEEMNRYIKE